MVNRELLQGQKLLGWVLILTGLLLLILIGLTQSLVNRSSLPMLGAFASWDPTMTGIVAWFLLAAGYVFVQSAHLEERLRDIEGLLEERINRLTRELTALQQRIGDRPGADHPEGAPGDRSPGGTGP